MSETRCRWDRDAKAHLTREHLPECVDRECKGCKRCTHDDAGNPVRHCRTRNRCTSHLGWGEHVCPECVGKIRGNLTRIVDAVAAMPAEVEEVGRVDRTAAADHLATAHPESWRRRMLHNAEHGGWTEEPDQHDPWQMLGLRERMIREDLGHDHRLVSDTLAGTCDYLAWVLTDLARMEGQTLVVAELLGETTRLATHLEAVLHDSRTPERGIPCPECVVKLSKKRDDLEAAGVPKKDWPNLSAPRLVRRYGHWCRDLACVKEHFTDTSGDVWACSSCGSEWPHKDYEDRLVERRKVTA